MQIMMNVKLPATVKKSDQGNWYVSCCPVLDVFSQGETKEKALSNLSEALRLFFLSCLERGTLDEVLKESGFVPMKRPSLQRKAFPKGYESVNVPLPFRTTHRDPLLCPA